MEDKEELLRIARELYPMGTKYHPVGYGPEDKKRIEEVTADHFISEPSGYVSIDAGWGYIYTSNDGWAEIVKTEIDIAREIIYKEDV